MPHKTLLAATLIALVALTAPGAWCAPPPMEFAYHGNVDPEADNSAGPGLRFDQQRNVNGTVVYDADAIDELAFEIADDYNDGENCGSGLRAFYSLYPGAGIDQGTIVGRIKTIADTHVSMDCGGEPQTDVAAGNLGILDPVSILPYNWGNSACLHWGGANGDIREIYRGNSTTVAGDSAYHIFRMTITGRYGGYSTTSWSENFNDTATFPAGLPLAGRGGWTGNAGAEISVENTGGSEQRVKMTLGGGATYTNASRVLGAISADSQGKLTIEMKIQYASGNTGGNCWRMYFYDQGDNEIASWYGQSTTVRPRRGGTILDTRTVSTTGWDDLKIVADSATKICRYYFNGEEIGSTVGSNTTYPGLAYTADTVLDEVYISHWNVVASGTVYFDDFSVAGGLNIPSPERIIKVYMDENPTPVMVINNAAEVNSADLIGAELEGFMFGTDDTIALQTVRFDWVTGTNQGAFAPGEEVAVLGHSLVPTAGTQPRVATLDQAKTAADGTSVSIPSSIVTIPYLDDDASPWFFGIEKADRTAGMRVLSNAAVEAGQKVKIVGVTATTEDGERVIEAFSVTDADPPGIADVPDPLLMNNRATGGGAFGAQAAAVSYSLSENPTIEPFSYPNGALVGKGTWTGTADASHIGVVDGSLRVYFASAGYAARTLVYNPASSSYKLTFQARKGAAGTQPAGFIWHVFMYADNPTHQEIGRWYGTWDSATPRRIGNVGAVQPLSDSWTTLAIELIPATVGTENIARWYVGDTQVWQQQWGGTLGTNIRRPLDIQVMNNARSPDDIGQYVVLDNFALTNMWFVPTPVSASGLNNVGLVMRLCGRVTARYKASTPDANGNYVDNYFYVDDGSGLLGPYPVSNVGIRCAAPRYGWNGAEYVPAYPGYIPFVDDYVAVYGILGLRNGERYFHTYAIDWIVGSPPT